MTTRFWLVAVLLTPLALAAPACSSDPIGPAPSPPSTTPHFTNLEGIYTLTIAADGCEEAFPIELTRRSYTAIVKPAGRTPGGDLLTVTLSSAVFRPDEFERTNRFHGWIEGDQVRFVLDYWTLGAAIVERPSPEADLMIEGTAITTFSPDRVEGTFTGYWLVSGPSFPARLCQSNQHGFMMTRM